MPLTPAEKQRRYRERLKKNPEKLAEFKRKELERYHASKRLICDMTLPEQQYIKKKWRTANAKRRKNLINSFKDSAGQDAPPARTEDHPTDTHCVSSGDSQDSTAAKRMRTYRERMKSDPNKFELLRKKENEWHRASRKKLSEERTSEKDIIARRIAWAERKRRQRQKKQLNAAPTQGEQRITEQSSDGDFSESLSNSTAKEPPIKKQKESDPVERQNELLKMACDLLSSNCKQEETNECLDIAKVWGTKLMSLDPMQRRFAEKAINDVLFEADMGTLHRDSVQINSNISHNPLAIP